MSIRKVVVYPSQLVHWATPRRTEVAALLEVEEGEWWYWKSICGKEVTGRRADEEFYPEVTCRSCLRSFQKAKREYDNLVKRFGGGDTE